MQRLRSDWIRSLVAVLAVAGVPLAASGFPSITMPSGSTVWIKAEASACAGGGDDDCVGSNQGGVNPPNGIPLTTFPSASSGPFTIYSEVLPDRVRSSTRSRSGAFLRSSFVDTYTVHGAAVGTFPIMATLAGTGTARSETWTVPYHVLLGANVRLELGYWDPNDGLIHEDGRVVAFTPGPPSTGFLQFASTVQTASFEVPFSLSATHAMTVGVGDSFTIAYGVNLAQVAGTIDFDDTGAEISFDLPEGVWITSEKGAVFGDPPAPQVPLPPFAAGLAAASLVALGCRSLRRTRNRSRGR